MNSALGESFAASVVYVRADRGSTGSDVHDGREIIFLDERAFREEREEWGHKRQVLQGISAR